MGFGAGFVSIWQHGAWLLMQMTIKLKTNRQGPVVDTHQLFHIYIEVLQLMK